MTLRCTNKVLEDFSGDIRCNPHLTPTPTQHEQIVNPNDISLGDLWCGKQSLFNETEESFRSKPLLTAPHQWGQGRAGWCGCVCVLGGRGAHLPLPQVASPSSIQVPSAAAQASDEVAPEMSLPSKAMHQGLEWGSQLGQDADASYLHGGKTAMRLRVGGTHANLQQLVCTWNVGLDGRCWVYRSIPCQEIHCNGSQGPPQGRAVTQAVRQPGSRARGHPGRV
jgi:hypothetical protein